MSCSYLKKKNKMGRCQCCHHHHFISNTNRMVYRLFFSFFFSFLEFVCLISVFFFCYSHGRLSQSLSSSFLCNIVCYCCYQLSYLSAALSQASGVSTAGKLSVVKSSAFVATTSAPSCSVRQRFCANDDDVTESLCILLQSKSNPVANVHLSPSVTVSPLLEW